MFGWWRTIKQTVQSETVVAAPVEMCEASQVFWQSQSADTLLVTPRRQKLLSHIWQRTSMARCQFDVMYLEPIKRYAELVQQFPASESHHHSYPGGMLDHGLEIVAYALKLRQSYLLPVGAPPESQAAQSEAWTAGAAYGALLHDIGKIAVDIDVETADGKVWHPWQGVLQQPYRFRYRGNREYRLHDAAVGLLYNRILDSSILDWLSDYDDLWSVLLYVLAGQMEHAGILGEIVIKADQASVAQALGGDPTKAVAAPKHALQRKLLDGLRYLVKEQLKLNQPKASDGWLTDDALWLVSKTVADKLKAHLLSQGVSGIPESNPAIFNVLQEHAIIQPTLEGKAIWTATVKSSSGWSHEFTFLKMSPAMIWETGARPLSFAGVVEVAVPATDDKQEIVAMSKVESIVASPPSIEAKPTQADSLDTVLGLLQPMDAIEPEPVKNRTPFKSNKDEPLLDKNISLPETPKPVIDNGKPSGEHFMNWLRNAILDRKLIINDAKAMVHTVADTVYLVTPGIFMRYAQEYPSISTLAKEENIPEWRWIQKQFEKLGLHKKQKSGLNIWTCIVTGPRKTRRVHGYLLLEPTRVLPEMTHNNPYLELSE
jgi:integrating conjugative element relaxase, PFL_4751 family